MVTGIQVQVGDGCTMPVGSDRYAGTVVAVLNDGKRIGVKYDIAKRVDSNGYGGNQVYEFEQNTGPTVMWFTLRKDGTYVKKGESLNGWCQRCYVGFRKHYMDPHF